MVVSEGADAPASRDDATGAIDVQSLGFLLGAAALWGTYPTCVKLLYRAGPPIDPAIVVLLRFIVMAAISVGALSAARRLRFSAACRAPRPPPRACAQPTDARNHVNNGKHAPTSAPFGSIPSSDTTG